MKGKKVLLGLSGGVDSAVAALLLKKQGYEVIGAFMKNFSDTKSKLTGECMWLEECAMAEKVAAHLNIPFIILDFEKQYKKHVLDPMFKAYARGLTPNPDIACNAIIKFPLLWKEAQKYRADCIATGHYARIQKTKTGFRLRVGKDREKDQSYFLYELTQHDLSHTLFPVGELTKAEVREIARKNKFPNANKRSTRGICFVSPHNMKQFLKNKIKEKPGPVMDVTGAQIGTHRGIQYYTRGERAGARIGITFSNTNTSGSQAKLYIVHKDIRKNSIVLAPKNHPLARATKLELKNFHKILPAETLRKNVRARVRHRGELIPATLHHKKDKYTVTLKKAVSGTAPGQSLVIYHGPNVLGGGEISV